MKPIKTIEQFRKETKYPYLATLTQFDSAPDIALKEEVRSIGAEKYMAGFNLALNIITSLGEKDKFVDFTHEGLVNKIKEIAKL